MDIHEQNLAYEESLLQDREREFQEQLKMIEELSLKEAYEKEKEAINRSQQLIKETEELLDECDKKPTKEELRILRMKFYIGNNNGKNTK
jgi:hypothetical protein